MACDIALQSETPTAAAITVSYLGEQHKKGVLSRTMSLMNNSRRWRTHSEVVLALGRSKGEAEWALAHLVEAGKLEVAQVNMGGIVRPFNKYLARTV